MKRRVLSVLVVLAMLYAVAKQAEAKGDIKEMIDSGYYQVEATAYCDSIQPTASGELVRYGICAGAKEFMGCTIEMYDSDMNLMGYFECLDTGSDRRLKNGSCFDIWLPTYDECIEFGRQRVFVRIIDAEG